MQQVLNLHVACTYLNHRYPSRHKEVETTSNFNVEKTFDFVKTNQHWNLALFQRWNLMFVSTLKSDVETTLKIGYFPDVGINNVVSTLQISCSTSRPKINLKITMKPRCVLKLLLILFQRWLPTYKQMYTNDLRYHLHCRNFVPFHANCGTKSFRSQKFHFRLLSLEL